MGRDATQGGHRCRVDIPHSHSLARDTSGKEQRLADSPAPPTPPPPGPGLPGSCSSLQLSPTSSVPTAPLSPAAGPLPALERPCTLPTSSVPANTPLAQRSLPESPRRVPLSPSPRSHPATPGFLTSHELEGAGGVGPVPPSGPAQGLAWGTQQCSEEEAGETTAGQTHQPRRTWWAALWAVKALGQLSSE